MTSGLMQDHEDLKKYLIKEFGVDDINIIADCGLMKCFHPFIKPCKHCMSKEYELWIEECKKPICRCVDVEMGSHDAAICIDLPPHMEAYKQARIDAGLSPHITIDHCIVPYIHKLWSLDIKTMGSCCGHGKIDPSVCVADDDIEKMIDLGYKQMDKSYIFELEKINAK